MPEDPRVPPGRVGKHAASHASPVQTRGMHVWLRSVPGGHDAPCVRRGGVQG